MKTKSSKGWISFGVSLKVVSLFIQKFIAHHRLLWLILHCWSRLQLSNGLCWKLHVNYKCIPGILLSFIVVALCVNPVSCYNIHCTSAVTIRIPRIISLFTLHSLHFNQTTNCTSLFQRITHHFQFVTRGARCYPLVHSQCIYVFPQEWEWVGGTVRSHRSNLSLNQATRIKLVN